MNYQLTAVKRAMKGDHVREEGQLPAVVYGGKEPSQSVSLGYSDFVKLYRQAGDSTLLDLVLDGSALGKVIVQDVQTDPVTDRIIHVDFKRIDMKKKMRAPITLKFVGESPAVKGAGGTLVTTLHTVEVECLPQDLVSNIEIRLEGLKTFDDVIKVQDLVLPTGITVVSPANDSLVAKVAAPLTEEQLKAMEETKPADLSAIEVAGEKEKAEAAAAKEAEGKPEAAKKDEKKEEKK